MSTENQRSWARSTRSAGAGAAAGPARRTTSTSRRERPAADLAVRSSRPAGSGRDGTRFGGACRDPRPRGRGRPGGQGGGTGQLAGSPRPAAGEDGRRPRQRLCLGARRARPRGGRQPRRRRRDRASEGGAAAGCRSGRVARPARAAAPLPDRVGCGPRGRLRDRFRARGRGGSRSARPTCARKPARSRRGSTGRGGGS